INRRSVMSNREFFLQLCSSEYPRFFGVLQATPADRLDYRPHPRSRSGYELVSHMIGHELDLGELVETGTINHRVEVPFATMEDAMRIYRQAHESLRAQLATLGDDQWDSIGQFMVKSQVL